MAHLLTLISDFGGFVVEEVNYMNAIDFSNAILSPEPTNYLTNDSVETRTQPSTCYNACLHFLWPEVYLQVFKVGQSKKA